METRIVAGLGNPGRKYYGTRHNAGFRVVDELCELLGVDMPKRKFSAFYGESQVSGRKVIFLKPQEYMNRSGESVATAVGFAKLRLQDLLVISDDMDLEPGRIRIRPGGSSGGHNGLQNIIDRLGSDEFPRLRVGIGKPETAGGVGYVLSKPAKQEWQAFESSILAARDAALCWIERGLGEAMNRFNG